MSGYYRALDAVVMRVGDGLMAIPSILLALALMTLVRASVETVIAALVVPETPRVVRMARQAIRGRQQASMYAPGYTKRRNPTPFRLTASSGRFVDAAAALA